MGSFGSECAKFSPGYGSASHTLHMYGVRWGSVTMFDSMGMPGGSQSVGMSYEVILNGLIEGKFLPDERMHFDDISKIESSRAGDGAKIDAVLLRLTKEPKESEALVNATRFVFERRPVIYVLEHTGDETEVRDIEEQYKLMGVTDDSLVVMRAIPCLLASGKESTCYSPSSYLDVFQKLKTKYEAFASIPNKAQTRALLE